MSTLTRRDEYILAVLHVNGACAPYINVCGQADALLAEADRTAPKSDGAIYAAGSAEGMTIVPERELEYLRRVEKAAVDVAHHFGDITGLRIALDSKP